MTKNSSTVAPPLTVKQSQLNKQTVHASVSLNSKHSSPPSHLTPVWEHLLCKAQCQPSYSDVLCNGHQQLYKLGLLFTTAAGETGLQQDLS